MSALALLADLRNRGVRLHAVDGRLVVDAPPGVVGADELERLRAEKAAIIDAIQRDREIGEESDERSGVWWDDPTVRPPPSAADAFDRSVRESLAPILHLPPRGCVAPVACSRLKECDRRRDGMPCRVTP